MLSGKTALVTGGSRGIGRAIVTELAKNGAYVYINYQGNENAAKETLEQITALGCAGEIIRADVSSPEQVEQMVKLILEKSGRLEILVNNAGITRDQLIMRMKDEDWNQVISTNLTGVFNCIRAVTRPMMKQKEGRIINVSSIVGLTGNAGQINYSAAKAGIIGLTKSAAKELASRGIMVNAVAPGYIITEMTGKLGEEAKKQFLAGIPLGRLGMPEDVASVVLFLAGPGAGYLTGQVITVDGGLAM